MAIYPKASIIDKTPTGLRVKLYVASLVIQIFHVATYMMEKYQDKKAGQTLMKHTHDKNLLG